MALGVWEKGPSLVIRPRPLPIPPPSFSLCPVEGSPKQMWRAGCQEPGSFAQWQLDVSVGAMRVAGVSQGMLTLYTREDMKQLCLQPTGDFSGWGAPWIQQGSGLLFCPDAEALG